MNGGGARGDARREGMGRKEEGTERGGGVEERVEEMNGGGTRGDGGIKGNRKRKKGDGRGSISQITLS